MHDHNKKGGGNGMLWMMIPCLILLGVLFLGGNKLSGSGYLWPILIVGFVVLHVWMMFKGHGHGQSDSADAENRSDVAEEKQSENGEHKHGGSCH